MSPWKALVRKYADARNRAELYGDAGTLRHALPELSHLQRWVQRMERVQEVRDRRGIQPERQETRMRLAPVRMADREVVTDVQFMQTMTYLQHGKTYREARIERERIWLKQRNGTWRIERIEPVVAEKNSAVVAFVKTGKPGGTQEESGYRDTERKPPFPGQPYMNWELLSGQHGASRQRVYDRNKAKAYADRWWNEPNPGFVRFQVDCTNYVSQCLYAGGAPMNYTGNRASGWWYERRGSSDNWSFSWSVSNSLYWYLNNSKSGLTAKRVQSPGDLDIGDVIIYDWDGDGAFQHSTIVTAFDGNGMPLVNAHTTNSRHRYWEYKDSYAWSEKTVYRFFHISDVF